MRPGPRRVLIFALARRASRKQLAAQCATDEASDDPSAPSVRGCGEPGPADRLVAAVHLGAAELRLPAARTARAFVKEDIHDDHDDPAKPLGRRWRAPLPRPLSAQLRPSMGTMERDRPSTARLFGPPNDIIPCELEGPRRAESAGARRPERRSCAEPRGVYGPAARKFGAR